MNVTLTVDVGDEERVLLVPKHEGEYAAVGTVARVTDRVRLPGGAIAVALEGLHRGVAGAAETDPHGPPPRRGRGASATATADERTRELETEYRAVVEEILELRGDDGRIQAFIRSISEPGALADTSGYSPDLSFEQKVELLETVDVAERLELALSYPARAALDDADPPADPRGRQRRDGEAAARVPPPEADGLDPEGARRGRRVGRRGVPHQDRRGGHARGRPRAGRQGARPLRADGRELARVADDPQLPRLAARRAVGRHAPTRCSTRSTPARCSTPTTPASRTSRTGSSSTSRSRSCARSAASRPTSGPARS